MIDLCPGILEQKCGRPLKSGEDLCPSCRSQKRRARARRVLMGPLGWVSLATDILVEKALKSAAEAEKALKGSSRKS